MESIILTGPDITCSHCGRRAAKALAPLPDVESEEAGTRRGNGSCGTANRGCKCSRPASSAEEKEALP